MTGDESFPALGLVPEVKATAILSIRDSMRQRGLSVDEAAVIADVDPEELRGIIEGRVSHVSLETLGSIMEALEAPGRKP